MEQIDGLVGFRIVTGQACTTLRFVRQKDEAAGGIEGAHVGHRSASAQARHAHAGLIGVGLDLVQAGQVLVTDTGRHLPGGIQLIDVVGHLGHGGRLGQRIEKNIASGRSGLHTRQQQGRNHAVCFELRHFILS